MSAATKTCHTNALYRRASAAPKTKNARRTYGQWGATRRHATSERRPDLELRAPPPDALVRELRRPGVAAEVGGADAVRDRLETRLADRAACLLRLLVGVGEERRAGEDHRHRVRDVLALERGRGAVRRLGHDRARDEVAVERDEERLRAGDRAEQGEYEVGEDVAVAVQRRDDERRAARGDEEREGGVDELRLVLHGGMAPRGRGPLLPQHP